MRDPDPNDAYKGLMHAGAASALFLVQACVIIPGLLPALMLAGVIGLVLVLPVLVLSVLVALLAGPPYLLLRLLARNPSKQR